MHGGERDKKTSLKNLGKMGLKDMAIMCDNRHAHNPWGLAKSGLFATAIERNYPDAFCKKVGTHAARAHMIKKPRINPGDGATRREAGKQSRRGEKDFVATKANSTLAATPCPNEMMVGQTGLGKSSEENWTPKQFVDLAMQRKHPMDEVVKVPLRVAEVIYAIATRGPSWTVNHRLEVIEHYTGIAEKQEAKEKELHSKLHADLEKVVARKKILLFKQMLVDIHYDDMDVVNFLNLGVPLVGKAKESNIWPKDESKLPRCEVKHLWSTARQSQEEILQDNGR